MPWSWGEVAVFKILWFIRGYVCLEICGASPGWALNGLSDAGVPFWNVCWQDSLTVRICVPRRYVETVFQVAEKAMCDCRQIKTSGLPVYLHQLAGRPVLVVMTLLSLLTVIILQQFVFFYEVSGNETVSQEEILRELSDLGIGFGVYGPSIHPQWVKDNLLSAMPQLQWVTVTQNGCRAQVVVRERTQTPQTESRKGYANVIATRAGVITQQSVFAGQAQFQVGDTVSKGDLLVSGIVDLERIYVLEQASAEVFARTWRDSTVVIPTVFTKKTEYLREKQVMWLLIGQRRIKIFGNSGISGGSCDKMKETKKLSLPGGLELPVSLEIETLRWYEPITEKMPEATAKELLSTWVERRAVTHMRAGQVLQKNYALEESDGCYLLRSTLECHEMIAQVVPGQWKNEEFIHD